MATFVTLQQAKDHLYLTTADGDPDDVDLQRKIDQAEGLVLDRCNTTAFWRTLTPAWTAETVPPAVQAAILIVLAHLWEHRGDDMTSDPALAIAVDRILGAHKDPVLA